MWTEEVHERGGTDFVWGGGGEWRTMVIIKFLSMKRNILNILSAKNSQFSKSTWKGGIWIVGGVSNNGHHSISERKKEYFRYFVCQEIHCKQTCQISKYNVYSKSTWKGGIQIVGRGGGSVEQWPSCLTNQPCMDTQNTPEHRTNRNNKYIFSFLEIQ